MSAETFTGNLLNGFNAAITSPAAANLVVLGTEVFIGVLLVRKALQGIGVLDS